MSDAAATTAQLPRSKRRASVLGASIGTLIEYYDYYLYGQAAAVVFPAVFFPSDDPVSGALQSFGSFAVGFLLRPIGGIVFGHIGDRFGRRRALMITVIGMGIATTGIGLVPSANAIGTAAPVILLILRMIQGLAVGGEMGGATALIVEHAPPGRRGLYGALLISGAGVAMVLSAGLMALMATGSDAFYFSWGWRIPFLFSAVLVVVAIVLRMRLTESHEFTAAREQSDDRAVTERVPLLSILRRPGNAILAVLIGLVQATVGYVVLTYGLNYIVGKGTSKEVGFLGNMIVGALEIVAAPLWGLLSDRIGRRPVYLIGAGLCCLTIFPVFALYRTNEPIFIWLGMILGFTLSSNALGATIQTLYSEMFDVRERVTGVNIGYQLSNTIAGGFAPAIAVALAAAAGGATWPVGLYVIMIAVVSAVATLFATIRRDDARPR